MTKEEIIEMAKQTGLAIGVALDGSKSVGKHEDKSFAVGRLPLDDFVAFAKMIAEKEREACIKIVMQGTGEPIQRKTLDILHQERTRIALAIKGQE